eukprot:jgi/Mesvir1/18260/Mv09530-RA.2
MDLPGVIDGPAGIDRTLAAPAPRAGKPRRKRRRNKKRSPLEIAIFGDNLEERQADDAPDDAAIAEGMGFPSLWVTDDELDAGVASSEDMPAYLILRNHLLSRWRRAVGRWLSEEEVAASVSPPYRRILSSAYAYVMRFGYINSGVAPAVVAQQARLVESMPSKGEILVIGAGLAGLAAARQLKAFGFKVKVLEGRDRAGGRVASHMLKGGGLAAAVDLGGSVITGTDGNPLAILAEQLQADMHKIGDRCPLFLPCGRPVEEEMDKELFQEFNDLLDCASGWREEMPAAAEMCCLETALETAIDIKGLAKGGPEERQLLDWHFANLEYANAGLLGHLSLAHWDQDDPYEITGDHVFLRGSNGYLIDYLTEGLDIYFGCIVKKIHVGQERVEVTATAAVDDGDLRRFQADAVLCTLPLGVLKKKVVAFEPELPPEKLAAIERLGFGLLNKVALLFERVFWDPNIDTVGHLAASRPHRGQFFLFYSYARTAAAPVLIALVAGQAARDLETPAAKQTAVEGVMKVLRDIYGPQGVDVPDPLDAIVTQWAQDPMAYGSYSNIVVGSSGKDYDILAQNVGGRLFFAGEHTTRKHPATMHGAFFSGLREAGLIMARFGGPASQARSDAGSGRHVQSLRDSMRHVFKQPDMECGNVAVVLSPANKSASAPSLLRVKLSLGSRLDATRASSSGALGGPLGKSSSFESALPDVVPVYCVITRLQAYQVMEFVGTDEDRLRMLMKDIGVKVSADASSAASSAARCLGGNYA